MHLVLRALPVTILVIFAHYLGRLEGGLSRLALLAVSCRQLLIRLLQLGTARLSLNSRLELNLHRMCCTGRRRAACLRLGAAATPAELELDRAAGSNTAVLQRAVHRFAAVIERKRPARHASLRCDDARESCHRHRRRSVNHGRAPRPRHLQLQRYLQQNGRGLGRWWLGGNC
eukprot:scaffold35916_cov68-Phaeocystis_antarctica.AAC.7